MSRITLRTVISRLSINNRTYFILSGLLIITIVVSTLAATWELWYPDQQNHNISINNNTEPWKNIHNEDTVSNSNFTVAVVSTTTYPTASPTVIKSASEYDCLHGEDKRSDRLAHQEIINRGKFICATEGRYRMGLDYGGDLIWRDDVNNVTKLMASGGHHFSMTKKGVLVLYEDESDDTVSWTVDTGEDIKPQRCLADYRCPYLHLHNGGGTILNYINSDGQWIAQKIQKAFGLKW